jgi:hypothetical protein
VLQYGDGTLNPPLVSVTGGGVPEEPVPVAARCSGVKSMPEKKEKPRPNSFSVDLSSRCGRPLLSKPKPLSPDRVSNGASLL